MSAPYPSMLLRPHSNTSNNCKMPEAHTRTIEPLHLGGGCIAQDTMPCRRLQYLICEGCTAHPNRLEPWSWNNAYEHPQRSYLVLPGKQSLDVVSGELVAGEHSLSSTAGHHHPTMSGVLKALLWAAAGGNIKRHTTANEQLVTYFALASPSCWLKDFSDSALRTPAALHANPTLSCSVSASSVFSAPFWSTCNCQY